MLGLSVLLMLACQGPPAPRTTVLEVDAREYSRLFEAAVLVLRDTGFDVAREDYRFGEVASQPLKSPLFFEFWEPTHGHGLTLQGSSNDERRVARVYFEPAPPHATKSTERTREFDPNSGESAPENSPGPASRYLMGVEIVVERLQRPARYLTHSSQQPAATLADVPAEVAQLGVYGPYWQPVGRDDALAAEVLRKTVRRSLTLAREQTTPPAPTAPTAWPGPGPVDVSTADDTAF